jgi:hypothetical protein
MKPLILIVCYLLLTLGQGVAQQRDRNLIVITLDGFRWQEVFKGIDPVLARDTRYHEGDSAHILMRYGGSTAADSRSKLLPFLWGTVAAKGQLYGNRTLGCQVDVANPHWFSYPGYSEIFTGYPDPAVDRNDHPPNPHQTVLEFFNRQPGLRGRVAAFCAWEAFNRILNEERSGFPVIAAFDRTGGPTPTPTEKRINAMRTDSYKPWLNDECQDLFTHYAALEWLKTRKPRVLYVAYGETDEWAHAGKYRSYLDAAHQIDTWIRELWTFVQSDPQYRNKTSLFITVDHGRGDFNKDQWTDHGASVPDSHETWFAVMGPDVPFRGEVSFGTFGLGNQLYQQHFAQTMARLMGLTFTAVHPVAEALVPVFKINK